jgi:ATP synthase assembly factor FMC1
MAQAPKLRSLYRQLLRELPIPTNSPATASSALPARSKPSILSHPSPIKTRIRSSFTSPTSPIGTVAERSEAYVAGRVQEAEQYIQYLRAQRTYTTLLERYNPGADMDEEERVRLTARRVGMEMPVEFKVKPWGRDGNEGGEK